MARKNHDALPYDTIRLEGALFVPDLLEQAARGDGTDQKEGDYHLPKGITFADEQGRAFQIARAQWRELAPSLPRHDLDPLPVTLGFIREFLQDSLHYSLERPETVETGGRIYPVPLMAHGRIPVFVAPHCLGLDESTDLFPVIGSGSRKRSVFRLAQEFLNASPGCTWAMVSNGRRLRLLRDSATLTRPCFLEFDLETILEDNRYPDFVALWRLLHGSRAGESGTPGHSCIWEDWRAKGLAKGTRVREGLRDGVTRALVVLGNGFLGHPGNEELRNQLREGTLPPYTLFQELLRVVYRCLFLFTLEERTDESGISLLHPPDASSEAQTARRLYCEGYSLKRLRTRALRPTYDRYDDLWQGLTIVFRSLHRGEPRLALPALGGLFGPDQCAALNGCALGNRDLLEAIINLRWARIDGNMALVDYRNMGPEELGSVYESLLELVPSVDPTASRFGFVGITEEGDTSGHTRKTTGSYYTPDILVQELIRSALDPVIKARIEARPDNPTEALLDLTVLDPACGSGHFLLAAARRLAEHLAELRAIDGAVRPEDYRHALREVISRCIFGVDKNPMALELARFALWLEGFEPGRPLSFLNHHLVCGDALFGLADMQQLANGISSKAYKPLSGDDKAICQDLTRENKASQTEWQHKKRGQFFAKVPDEVQDAWSRFAALENMPDNNVDDIDAKIQAYKTLLAETNDNSLQRAADLFVGAFLAAKTDDTARSLCPTTSDLLVELFAYPDFENHATRLKEARRLCAENRILHWPLAFPQISIRGGFDCVLANPPWERIKLQEEEFFATRHPDVATAKNKAERGQRIAWLAQGMLAKQLTPESGTDEKHCAAESRLYQEFINARRTAEASSLYAHLKRDKSVKKDEGGRFPLTGVGDVNTYALFAETISQLITKDGRAGFIVPTGIATDDSTKAYFSAITQGNRLVSLYDFENREATFPGVHRSYKFCLLTLGTSQEAHFSFFLTQTEQLADQERAFTLRSEDFLRINPNTQTCPVFRSRMDAELTRKIYNRVPVLIREAHSDERNKKQEIPEENPWGIRFMRMLDMANDSHLFADAADPGKLPLYEAKMMHQFDHRWAEYRRGQDGTLSTVDIVPEDKQNPEYAVTPRYWVASREVFLRTANLPKGLLQALRENNEEVVVLAMTAVLFGQWLHLQGLDTAAKVMQQLYPSWLDFVGCFPYAADIAPVRLGFCEANPLPALLETSISCCLPAEPVDKITNGPRTATAWYAANEMMLSIFLDQAIASFPAIDQAPVLPDAMAALTFVEQLLEMASPKWLMGWRDICRSTDERTVIASIVPRAGTGDTLLLMFPSPKHGKRLAALLADQCSLVHDFAARQKVGGTHLKYHVKKQLPILPPEHYSPSDLDFIVPRVIELTYTSDDLKTWAEDLGYTGPTFTFDPERRAQLRAELDAYYVRLYGLTRDELRYILDPVDVMGEGYPSETFRVLKNIELRQFGEYRTQRLVLEAWDRQAVDNDVVVEQFDYQENPQVFPWPGRERFVYNIIPHLVRAKAGGGFEYYRDAALLASRPEYLRSLLSARNLVFFDALPQEMKDICSFPSKHHVRPFQLRKSLVTNKRIDIDAKSGATKLGSAADLPEVMPNLDQLLPFILEAADNLRQYQESTIEALETKQREATIQAAQFIQAVAALA